MASATLEIKHAVQFSLRIRLSTTTLTRVSHVMSSNRVSWNRVSYSILHSNQTVSFNSMKKIIKKKKYLQMIALTTGCLAFGSKSPM